MWTVFTEHKPGIFVCFDHLDGQPFGDHLDVLKQLDDVNLSNKKKVLASDNFFLNIIIIKKTFNSLQL